MSPMFLLGRKVCSTMLFITLGSVGCGCDDEKASPVAEPTPVTTAKPAATQPIIPVAQMEDWCREHGMPESICVQCNPSLAAAFKEKGDWDEQHNLPKSQCFQCDPSLKGKFAAAYKAKYGKDAPTGGEDAHR